MHESTAANIALLLGTRMQYMRQPAVNSRLALILHPQGTRLGFERCRMQVRDRNTSNNLAPGLMSGWQVQGKQWRRKGKSGLEAITGALARAGAKGPPPVELWNPPFCGDLDMRIAADGTWFYLKTPIGRPALVKLFASVLKREGDKYFLVTPVEKCGITVEDAPFLAVELKIETRRRRPGSAFSHQCRRLGRLRAGARAALRAGSRDRRAQAVSACAPRPVGQGDARAVLRSGRARRGARRRRHGDVRRRLEGAFFAMAPAEQVREFA